MSAQSMMGAVGWSYQLRPEARGLDLVDMNAVNDDSRFAFTSPSTCLLYMLYSQWQSVFAVCWLTVSWCPVG